MGVLHSIVLAEPTWPVQMPQIQLIQSGSVRRQAVRRDRLRLHRLVVEKASEKPQRRLCVPPALDHEVQDFAFIVDSAPEIHPLPAIQQTISSWCQRGEGIGRRRFNRLAISGPNLIVQHRIVS